MGGDRFSQLNAKEVESDSSQAAPHERVLGVRFFCGLASEAVDRSTSSGGLTVIPAAPALLKLRYDLDYRQALEKADLALADSGLLTLLWRCVTGRHLKHISGLSYLRSLLTNVDGVKEMDVLWVVGSESEKEKAVAWLERNQFSGSSANCWVDDAKTGKGTGAHSLLLRIEESRPRHIIIALASGVQEKLGLYLREYLLYRPSIHCVGAALGFLTGSEPAMPAWAERWHLGWVARGFAQPRMILPRIGIAITLSAMVLKYRAEMPRLRTRWSDL